MRIIILDRDGVINEDSDEYIKSPQEWTPVPGSLEAIARLCEAGYSVYVVTNQSGIGRGLFSTQTLESIHNKMSEAVKAAGGLIAGVYYCPHQPEDRCSCRKPAPGMLDSLAKDLNKDIRGAPFVGDSLKDLEAASARGCTPILVRSGKGSRYEPLLEQHPNPSIRACEVVDDLGGAVDRILTSQ